MNSKNSISRIYVFTIKKYILEIELLELKEIELLELKETGLLELKIDYQQFNFWYFYSKKCIPKIELLEFKFDCRDFNLSNSFLCFK